jgi:hypothetical protein
MRPDSGGPNVGVEGIPAVQRILSNLNSDGIAQLAIGNSLDQPEDDFTIWQIHGAGMGARDTTVYMEHEGSGGLVLSEYGGQLKLSGLTVLIAPNSTQFGSYSGRLSEFWKHDARAHRRTRITTTTYTIDSEASGGGGVYTSHIFDPTANCTVTLPSVTAFMGSPSVGYGRVLELRNDSALYVVTLDGASSELIFRGTTGRLTFPLMPGASIKLIALDGTGAGWKVLAYDLPPMEVVITDSQYKALPTTVQTIVPSQIFLLADFAAGAYTGAAAISWLVGRITNGVTSFIANDNTASVPLTFLSVFNDATKKRAVLTYAMDTSDVAAGWGLLSTVVTNYTGDNTALVLAVDNGGVNFGGGNALNTLKAMTTYKVVAV